MQLILQILSDRKKNQAKLSDDSIEKSKKSSFSSSDKPFVQRKSPKTTSFDGESVFTPSPDDSDLWSTTSTSEKKEDDDWLHGKEILTKFSKTKKKERSPPVKDRSDSSDEFEKIDIDQLAGVKTRKLQGKAISYMMVYSRYRSNF